MRKTVLICSACAIFLLIIIIWNIQRQSSNDDASVIERIGQSPCAKFEYCESEDSIFITSEIKVLSNAFSSLDIIPSDIEVSEWIYKITFDCDEISPKTQEIVVLIGDKSMSINGVTYSSRASVPFEKIIDIFASKYSYFADYNEGIQSFMALACEVQSCTEQNGELYLTIIAENNGDRVEKTIRVSDDMKEELLSVDDMKKIIGVNISFTLSAETMKEDHIDTDNLNPFWYLMFSEQYDEDFLIVGISVNE